MEEKNERGAALPSRDDVGAVADGSSQMPLRDELPPRVHPFVAEPSREAGSVIDRKPRRRFFSTGRTAMRPDAYYAKLVDLPFERYAKAGYKFLFIDADNTLQAHGLAEVAGEARVLCTRIRTAGLRPVLFSNARSARSASLAASLGIERVADAHKPSPDALLRFLDGAGAVRSEAILVGDQYLTDILAAKRAGVAAVLVDRISPNEPWYIRIKRLLEGAYRRKHLALGYYDELLDGQSRDR